MVEILSKGVEDSIKNIGRGSAHVCLKERHAYDNPTSPKLYRVTNKIRIIAEDRALAEK